MATPEPETPSADPQAQESFLGAEQRPVRMRVSDRERVTHYANAFRSNASAEEVMLDLGINSAASGRGEGGGDGGGEVHFEVSNRIIMNYYTAKRLAMLLGNLVRRHEERFGELKLSVTERAKTRDNGQ